MFLHGGSGSWELGTELFDHLPPTVRWWGVDLPGHGGSPWTGRYALHDAADALAEWAPGPAWWYGHSYGGQVALALAGRHPELVRGLVIGGSPLTLPRMRALFDQTGERMRTWRTWCGRPEAELLVLLGVEPAGDGTMADLLGADHPYPRRTAAALHRHDPAFLDTMVGRTNETYAGLDDAATWLSAIQGPVMLLRADPTRFALTDDTDAELVRVNARDGQVVTLPEVGHGLQNFAPKPVADVLAELVA